MEALWELELNDAIRTVRGVRWQLGNSLTLLHDHGAYPDLWHE